MDTIDEFMWGYQRHFRISVEVTARIGLEQIGASVAPEAFLVGFAIDPAAARHPICVEPEDGPLRSDHLVEAQALAKEIFEADPERRIMHTNRTLHDSRQRWLLRRARAQAVSRIAEGIDQFAGKQVVASSAGEIGGYEVHSCLAFDRAPVASLPRLEGEEVNRFPAPSSFVGRLLDLVLNEADITIAGRDPGLGSMRKSAREMVVEATEDFVSGCFFRTGIFSYFHPCGYIDDVAIRYYESGTAHGRLLLVRPDHEQLETHLVLAAPVGLHASRAVRKLLEMTDGATALLVHDRGIYGLGQVRDPLPRDVFELRLDAHASWSLRGQQGDLIRSEYRQSALPKPILNFDFLRDVIERVIGADADVAALIDLVDTATGAQHGTTIVISAVAKDEAQRLGGQSTRIMPTASTDELLQHITQIDGAVLVDGAGVCHAIGVILDGHALPKGDPARGARFNSALRYERSAPGPTVIVIVSEDGDVNVVPALRPRVRRQAVADAVELLEAAAASDRPAAFGKAYDDVEALAFYLSPGQVARVNELAAAEHDRAMAQQAMAIVRTELKPNPDMDDSYFLD